MKYLATISCVLVCSALAPAQPAASATFHKAGAPQTHHLFVGVYGSGMPEILRFPFVNGFPATSPDLAYQNVLPPFNVGADGTLYATVPLACCQGLGTVDVFPPNSNQVGRQVTLPNLHEDTTIVTAVVEGPGSYLFVGYSAFISGAPPRGPRNARKQGVAVYPPNANGGGRPLRMFGVPHDISGPNAMAFDREGDLYYSVESAFEKDNGIITVANPVIAPRVIRELRLPFGVNAYGLAFSDDGSELYALSLGGPPRSPCIRTARTAKPSRSARSTCPTAPTRGSASSDAPCTSLTTPSGKSSRTTSTRQVRHGRCSRSAFPATRVHSVSRSAHEALVR